MKAWREECAVFGIWGHPEASRLAYLGLYALQHRGQESCGITTLHEEDHLFHKGLGRVADVFTESELDGLKGSAAIGHNRYSTAGGNQLVNTQPFTAEIPMGPLSLAHNGNLVNATELRKQLIAEGAIFQGSSDTECVLHLLARQVGKSLPESLRGALSKVVGAYSIVGMTPHCVFGVRDPLGFRPLVIGQLDQAFVLASESCAFDLIGAKFVREVEAGELVWVDKKGLHSEKLFSSIKTAQCVFEHVYFARPDSVVFGRSVYETRKQLGATLANEHPTEADIVVPVPDSGVPAAIGYAQASGLPFEYGIIRNHYVGRTFIEPKSSIRHFGVKVKLNPQSAVLKGKRVIVIDDSLVRGTTSKKIIGLIRQAGAKEIHLRIAAPPTIGPCYYGVDTPTRQELIAANSRLEEIEKFVEADSLRYLSMEGLRKAVHDNEKYCRACFDNQYPTPLFQKEKG